MAGELRESIYGEIAADFAEEPLRSLCDPEVGIQTGPFGSQLHQEDYVALGTPIITVEHLGENRILHDGVPRVSDIDRDRLSRYFLRKGDIVFSRVGSVDRRALVRSAEDGWMFSGRCLRVRPNPKKIDPGYLSYFFGLPTFREHIRAIAVGATMPSLNTTLLSNVLVPHPQDIAEQRTISHILGTLDDKIELNRRMNETLEAMARALFQSWFVDFDPVRAKAESRDPDLPEPLADLFPDSFENSELGEIPRGWDEGSFGEVISQRTERVGTRNVIVLSAVASGKLVRSDDHFTKRVYSKKTDKYLVVEQWDFAYNPSRINIGSIGMLEEATLGGVSPVYVVARPKPAYRWFLEFSIRRAWTKTWINTLASGSVRQSLSYADFASIPCVVPPEVVAQEFNRRWSALRKGIRAHEAESRTLAALRDALLPKLIAGELRLGDPAHFAVRGD